MKLFKLRQSHILTSESQHIIIVMLILFSLIVSQNANAQTTLPPASIPFQAVITDAAGNPQISMPITNLRVAIMTPARCILYYQDTGATTTDSKGLIAINLDGTGTLSAGVGTFKNVFKDNVSVTCPAPGAVTGFINNVVASPTAGPGRIISFSMNSASIDTSVDYVSIGSSAFAYYAENSNAIDGKTVDMTSTPPANNDVLTFISGVWKAQALATFTSGTAGIVPASGGGTTNFLRADGTWAAPAGGAGTVTNASVVTANGFGGSVATSTTTPAITITTSVNGIVKGNGTSVSAATAGTDYSAGTSALGTGIVKTTTGTGALSIAVPADFPTLNQNTTGNAATATTAGNVTGTVAIANGGTGQTTANGAFNALIPSQGSNAGKFLSTDGTNTSWQTVSTSPALSSITAASATNTFDNANLAQTWTWNTLTTQTAMALSSSTVTSGKVLQLQSTSTGAAANSQTVLDVSTSGANSTSSQTTYGAKISNTHTGTTSTNVGLYVTASGGTSNNYAAIFNAGNVGIGTATPATALDVAGTIKVAYGGEACGGGTAGAIRYNGGNIDYCNGASWTTLSSGGGAVSSVNTATGAVSLGIGTAGTAPSWSTTTLNIPMASTGGVTAGLISNAQYTNFPVLNAANVYTAGGHQINNASDIVGLTIKGTAGQALPLQEWKNSTNTVLAKIPFDGLPLANNDLATRGYVIGAVGSYLPLAGGTMSSGAAINFTGGASSFDMSAATGTFKTSTGVNTLSGDTTLAAGKNFTAAAGAGTIDLSSSTGSFKTTSGPVTLSGNTTLSPGKALTFTGSTSGTLTQTVPASVTPYSIVWPSAKAAANGYVLSSDVTGNLSWVAPGGGGIAGSLTTNGSIPYVSAANTVTEDNANFFWDSTNKGLGIGTASPNAHLQVKTLAPGNKGIIVKGSAAQTADLQQWQDSNGTSGVRVTSDNRLFISDGIFTAPTGTRVLMYDNFNPPASGQVASFAMAQDFTPTVNLTNGVAASYVLSNLKGSAFSIPNYTGHISNMYVTFPGGVNVTDTLSGSESSIDIGGQAGINLHTIIGSNSWIKFVTGTKPNIDTSASTRVVAGKFGLESVDAFDVGQNLYGLDVYIDSNLNNTTDTSKSVTAVNINSISRGSDTNRYAIYYADTSPDRFFVDSHGRIAMGMNTSNVQSPAYLYIEEQNDMTAIKVKAFNAQTNDILSFKDYSNSDLVRVTAKGEIIPTKWSNAGRPVSPVTGSLGYNTTLNAPEYYNGSSWTSLGGGGGGSLPLDGSTAMTGNLSLGNNYIQGVNQGTSATPSISFSGDSSTGIFRSTAAGNIGFASSGTEFMRLDNTGTLNLGDSITPIGNTKLYINTGAIGNRGIVVRRIAGQTANLQEWQNESGTPLLSIDPAGTIKGNDSSTAPGNVTLNGGNATAGNTLGGFVILNGGTGSGTSNGGYISLNAGSAQAGSSGNGGWVNIYSGNGGSGGTGGGGGAMNIVAGNGAGTGASAVGGNTTLKAGTGNNIANGGGIFITAGDSGASGGNGGNVNLSGGLGNVSGGEIRFSTAVTNSIQQRMVIDKNGKVGIGTPSPSEALVVTGNTQVNGQIFSPSGNCSSATTCDFNVSNVLHLTNNGGGAQAITLNGVRDGTSATVIVNNTAPSTTFNFSAPGYSFRYQPTNGPTVASSYTTYTFVCDSTICFVSWQSGY